MALPKIYQLTDSQAERARLDRARAEKVELEVAEKRRQLLNAEEVAQHWEAVAHNIKQQLLAVPTRAAPLVLGCKTLTQIKGELDRLMHRTLTELSETSPLGDHKS